jgi:hypothetical protein
MLSALLISMPALSGNVSVLSGDDPAIEETEVPAADQQAVPANTNTSEGALIETPATNSFESDVNAATNPAPPANANAASNQ